MPSRRTVLASLMASALGLPFAGAGPAAAFAGAAAGSQFGPEITRYGRHYIVNGWVLTAADLELLGIGA